MSAESEAHGGHLRLGQRAFNELDAVAPKIADRIRGTDADPFHSDDRIEAFVRAVASRAEQLRGQRDRLARACGVDIAELDGGAA